MYDFQKANMFKRISAFLFDLILLCIVAVGCAYLLSVCFGYDAPLDELDQIKVSYEEQYATADYELKFEISTADYEKLTDGQKEIYQEAYAAFAKDERANYLTAMIVNLSLLITSFAILLSFILLEFVVPLLFGNGQTVGKKVFGVALMREDGVKISPVILFIRTVLGKYAVETMIPVYIIMMIMFGAMGIMGLVTLGAILIIEIALIFTSRARTPLHDKLAHTVCVDMASQMIFDSPEARLEYQKRIHREQVASERD